MYPSLGNIVVAREFGALLSHPINEIVDQQSDVLAARGKALLRR
jgi:hypothetical protein